MKSKLVYGAIKLMATILAIAGLVQCVRAIRGGEPGETANTDGRIPDIVITATNAPPLLFNTNTVTFWDGTNALVRVTLETNVTVQWAGVARNAEVEQQVGFYVTNRILEIVQGPASNSAPIFLIGRSQWPDPDLKRFVRVPQQPAPAK